MALYLTVLGCGSATPTTHRYPSAFLLRSDYLREYILIDCGEGTQLRMRQNSIYMQRVGHIFISHLHGDHFFGLMGFLFTQNLLGRTEPLHVYAHNPLKKVIDVTLSVDKTVLQYPLIFHPIKGHTSVLLDDSIMKISAFELNHSIRAHGFLFQEKENIIKNENLEITSKPINPPKSFAYCSDTAYKPSIVKHIKGVDLLYHETTFMQNLSQVAKEKYHSTTIDAAKIAQKAKVGKLLIGHYSARYRDIMQLLEEARSVFPNTLSAKEDVTFKI